MQIKKNAIDLTDLAIGIMILGIVVTIGANIILNVRDSTLTSQDTLTTSNETITGSNTTAVDLTNSWFANVVSVTNTTGGETVLAGNYTVTANAATGTPEFLVVGSQYNGQGLNVTYNYYDTTGASWALPNNAAIGLAEYGNWFDIIVIVGIAGVILSLIFLAFGKDNRGSGAVSY